MYNIKKVTKSKEHIILKIILSPSKLQRESTVFVEQRKVFSVLKQQVILGKLQAMSYDQLKSFYKLKDKMADELYQLLRTEQPVVCDVFGMYNGIVFKEIGARSYDQPQLDYLREHGVVLSAMYGVLEADMAVSRYRLDMTKKLDGIDLYDYWQDDVDAYFKNVGTVVNLASLEFSRMLKNYNGRMINIHFVEEQTDGKLKVVTVRAKQARGLMFDYMVSNCIRRPEDIKNFVEAGYCYQDDISQVDDWYFVKRLEI